MHFVTLYYYVIVYRYYNDVMSDKYSHVTFVEQLGLSRRYVGHDHWSSVRRRSGCAGTCCQWIRRCVLSVDVQVRVIL